jgi:hypothetical protein
MFSYENNIFYVELKNEKNTLCMRLPYCGFRRGILRFKRRREKRRRIRAGESGGAHVKRQRPEIYQGRGGKRS